MAVVKALATVLQALPTTVALPTKSLAIAAIGDYGLTAEV